MVRSGQIPMPVAPGKAAPGVDPLRAIYQHCAAMPSESAERKTLQQIALSITQGSVGAIDENAVWKLGPVVLGLLDVLTERRIS